MCTDRPAEITTLLKKVEEVYNDTLGDYEYGSDNAPEIILKLILKELIITGLSSPEKIEKALQSF